MHMKSVKVSFHHPHYIYKFKLELSLCDNINMLNIDPIAIAKHFAHICHSLTLTS